MEKTHSFTSYNTETSMYYCESSRAGFNNSNTIRNFTLALSSNCTLVIQNSAMPLVNCKHIQASILRSLLFSDVTKSWLLVTDVSGQPTAPTFKGQAVQVFLNQQGGPKHWYLTTNKFCITSQNGEDLIQTWKKPHIAHQWSEKILLILSPQKFYGIYHYKLWVKY
jgi:hypothetical protein